MNYVFSIVDAKGKHIGKEFTSSGAACAWLDKNYPTRLNDKRPNQGYSFHILKKESA
jgi:hypothetical protein